MECFFFVGDFKYIRVFREKLVEKEKEFEEVVVERGVFLSL